MDQANLTKAGAMTYKQTLWKKIDVNTEVAV